MATLQIEFNCLCLFVRDETEKILHVLMPATGHHHAGHPSGSARPHPAHGIEEHLARLVLGDSPDAPQVPLEGWSLELGPAAGAAQLHTLDPPVGDAQVVDLTRLTSNGQNAPGRKVARALTTGSHQKIASRFTLRAGQVTDVEAQAEWLFKGEPLEMAHRVVWEIDDVPDELPWTPIAGKAPPLARLSDLGDPSPLPVSGKSGYRIRVFHTTADGLPPNDDPGALNKEEVRHHFGMFYDVLGLPDPDEELLPELSPDVEEGDNVNCGTAQAEMGA
jgi:hypothetical protein